LKQGVHPSLPFYTHTHSPLIFNPICASHLAWKTQGPVPRMFPTTGVQGADCLLPPPKALEAPKQRQKCCRRTKTRRKTVPTIRLLQLKPSQYHQDNCCCCCFSHSFGCKGGAGRTLSEKHLRN